MFEDDTTQSTQEEIEEEQNQKQEQDSVKSKYTKLKKGAPTPRTKVDKINFKTRASIAKTAEQNKKVVARPINGKQKKEKGAKAVRQKTAKGWDFNKKLPLSSFTKCVLEALYEMNRLKENE